MSPSPGDIIVSTFDPLNRLDTKQPGALALQTMTYDLAGRLLNINTPTDPDDPSSGGYGYEYDSAGRLIEQSIPDAKAVGYELDDNGNRTKLIYPDGYYASYFYDELNRLTDIKLNGSSTAAVHFDYDDLSRRTLVTYENGCTCDYAYAINDDLTALNQEFTGSAVNFAYSYNKVHQAIAMSCSNKAFVWTPGASATTVYSAANNLNQYPSVAGTGYSYNKNGCLTGGPFSATFDVLNRMTQVVLGGTTNDYILDPLNRQARKTSNTAETNFLYDGQQMIAEFDDGDALVNRYIRGNRADEILIKISGSTKTYLHHDRLGSVIAQTDDSGAVLNRYKYGPFGETPILTGTPFGYTGQRYDSEVGLYNYKARIYSPAIGRFLQPDPIGYDAGPLNIYAYVNHDPLNLVDPLGLAESCPRARLGESAESLFQQATRKGSREYERVRNRGDQHFCNVFVDDVLKAAGLFSGKPGTSPTVTGIQQMLSKDPRFELVIGPVQPGDITLWIDSQNHSRDHSAVVSPIASKDGPTVVYAGGAAGSGVTRMPLSYFPSIPTHIYRAKPAQ